jgi:hypothetical protein
MTGLVALGYMLIEEGKIVAIRNEARGIRVEYVDVREDVGAAPSNLQYAGWEIGFECDKCLGSGEISIPCPRCSGRSLHSLLENPCCDGYDEVKCDKCEGGIRWMNEY